MKDKVWWKSKTVYAGIIIALYGVLSALGVELPTELIISLAGALGLIGVRQAIGNQRL